METLESLSAKITALEAQVVTLTTMCHQIDEFLVQEFAESEGETEQPQPVPIRKIPPKK